MRSHDDHGDGSVRLTVRFSGLKQADDRCLALCVLAREAWYLRSMAPDFSLETLLLSGEYFEFAVNKKEAYQAFSKGIPILSEGQTGPLEEFCRDNQAEFYGDQIEGCGGNFRSFMSEGKRYYFTFHKHPIKEEHTRRLQEIERSHPAA